MNFERLAIRLWAAQQEAAKAYTVQSLLGTTWIVEKKLSDDLPFYEANADVGVYRDTLHFTAAKDAQAYVYLSALADALKTVLEEPVNDAILIQLLKTSKEGSAEKAVELATKITDSIFQEV